MDTKALEQVAARLISKTFPVGHIGIIKPLAGDASTRKYYRAEIDGGDPVVFMLAPDVEFVKSFLSLTRLMRSLHVDTPEIFAIEDNIAEMEDCGDVMLQDYASALKGSALLDEYKALIDSLIDFQGRAIRFPDKSHICFKRGFDVAKLTWETEFANKHFLKGYKGRTLEMKTLDSLRLEWDWIIKELADDMEVLTHRDFHSRNIMVHGKRRVWIDYQDACMGRHQYDLASLLYDPYVNLPAPVTDELADYYYAKLSEKDSPPWNYDRYLELLRLSGLQRIYKALGTYGYQINVHDKNIYEPYIAPALETLRMLTGRSKDLLPLGDILLDLVE